jgi:rhodanese-related sulfurtransferase
MPRFLKKLSFNQRLGAVALVLGALAVFADVTPSRLVTVHAKELLTGIERREDHVTPQELAAWIVEGRSDYRLVDIRDETAFAEYHIPGAENVPLATVADGALSRADRIVLYGEGGIHTAQAFMVLKGLGYPRVYTLLEGIEAWKDEVLFPVMPRSPDPEQQVLFARAAEVAKYFGGQPRAAAAAGAAVPLALPTQAAAAAVAPPPTLPGGARGGPKKKREGC